MSLAEDQRDQVYNYANRNYKIPAHDAKVRHKQHRKSEYENSLQRIAENEPYGIDLDNVTEAHTEDKGTSYSQELVFDKSEPIKIRSTASVKKNSYTISGRFLSQICCLFGTVPCHLCCRFLPSIRESTSTRLMYLILFFFTTALAVCALIPSLPVILIERYPYVNVICTEYLEAGDNCGDLFTKSAAVYKCCAGLISLHMLLIPFTICSTNSTSCVGALHNGFWLWKWVWLIGVDVALFLLLPGERFSAVAEVMRYIGLCGGALFILVNIFFICHVTIDFNDKLLRRAELQMRWCVLLWSITIALTAVTVLISYVLIHFYSACPENRVISSISIGACVILILLTVVPALGRGSKNADLLQGSIIISYVMYSTLAAVSNRPHGKFNSEVLLGYGVNIFKANPNASNSIQPNTSALHDGGCFVDFGFANKSVIGGSSLLSGLSGRLGYAGLAYYIFIAMYKSIYLTSKYSETVTRYATNSQLATSPDNVKMSNDVEKEGVTVPTVPKFEDKKCKCCYTCKPYVKHGGQKVLYNEGQKAVYNYGYMHFQFCCSILFIMMKLTNWFDPGSTVNLSVWSPNWAAYWVDILTAWALIVVYILTLLLPIHCQENRYYTSIVKQVAIDDSFQDVLLGRKRGNSAYYDKDGIPVQNIESFEGMLYMRSKQGILEAVREIKPVNEHLQVDSGIGVRFHTGKGSYHVSSARNVLYPMKTSVRSVDTEQTVRLNADESRYRP